MPDVEVVLEANGLLGQKQRTDAAGPLPYELVPKGRVMVTAAGLAGNVERVGRTIGYVGTAGQTLDLVVQMKAQGTVSGRVVDIFNGVERPLAHAYLLPAGRQLPLPPHPGGGHLARHRRRRATTRCRTSTPAASPWWRATAAK